MSDELKKAKRKRTTNKNIALNEIVLACETILQEEKNDAKIEEATVLLATLIEKVAEVKFLSEKFLDLIEDDAAYEGNEKKAYEFELQTRNFDGNFHAFVNG